MRGRFFSNLQRWVKGRRRSPAAETGLAKPEENRPLPGLDFVRNGDLVFDVGANIGRKTEDFLAIGAKVLCVEPQPACVGILREKFQSNPAVTVAGVGLADRPGRLSLSVCTEAPTISTFSDNWKQGRFANFKWDQTVSVEVTTLDELIKTHGVPQYCKIDRSEEHTSELQSLRYKR
jgi:FkbM family methyltransferase